MSLEHFIPIRKAELIERLCEREPLSQLRARLERLARRGFTAADLARLHGPVGLRINARSPAEIAISILAEIIHQLRPAKR